MVWTHRMPEKGIGGAGHSSHNLPYRGCPFGTVLVSRGCQEDIAKDAIETMEEGGQGAAG